LSGAGSISNSPSVIIEANAIFDVSRLTSTFALGSGQTLIGGGPNGTIIGSVNLDTGALALTYTNGYSTLTVTNSALTFDGSAVTVTVAGATPLPVGSYKLVAKATGGSVVGTLPSSVTVNGAGVDVGATASLCLVSDELYLVVNHPPVANVPGRELWGVRKRCRAALATAVHAPPRRATGRGLMVCNSSWENSHHPPIPRPYPNMQADKLGPIHSEYK